MGAVLQNPNEVSSIHSLLNMGMDLVEQAKQDQAELRDIARRIAELEDIENALFLIGGRVVRIQKNKTNGNYYFFLAKVNPNGRILN